MDNRPFPTPGKLYRLMPTTTIQIFSFVSLDRPYGDPFEIDSQVNLFACLPNLENKKKGQHYQMFLVSGIGKLVAFGLYESEVVFPLRVGQDPKNPLTFHLVEVEEEEEE